MKKLLIGLLLTATNLSYAMQPVDVMSNSADTKKEVSILADSALTLQTLITAVNQAVTVQQQLKALENVKNFQDNPAGAVTMVNNSVTGLLNSFNLSAGTSFTNLQQLINSMATSTSGMAANIKLMQASNIQLMTISNTLQQIQAQQQAIIAYKQAEIVQQQYQEQQLKKNNDATMSAMRGY